MPTIVDIAVQAGSFKTLVQAVQAAGLVETLSGEGPFTVFAPTDEAFAQIPQETLQAVLADKEKLTAILTYHVVPGKLMAADVVRSTQLQTAQGQAGSPCVATRWRYTAPAYSAAACTHRCAPTTPCNASFGRHYTPNFGLCDSNHGNGVPRMCNTLYAREPRKI